MKKIRIFFIAISICALLLTACKKTDDAATNTSESGKQSTGMTEEVPVQAEISEEDREEELFKEQRESYNFYIEEIDRMLSENRRQEQESEIYQESIGSIYLFSQSAYSGGLQASCTQKGTIAFQLVLTDARTEERQRYDCRLLADGSLWFIYQTESRNMLGYYSDSFQYRCENLLEERHINSLIWEKEYELFLTLKQYYPLMELNFHMVTHPAFYGARIVSGQVELYGHAEEDYDFRAYMPIMVDKQEGTYVTVTGLLDKEEFSQIFDRWAEDELSYDRITAEEKEQCAGVIERSWEKADLAENYLGNKEEILFLQIVQEGILMRVWSESDIRGHDYLIDKEYFWGTKAWDYLKPEGR